MVRETVDQTPAPRSSHDPAAQRPLWDVTRRRDDLLVHLNVIRNESHRSTITTTLSLPSGESPDERTLDIEVAIEAAVDELLDRTGR